MPHPLTPWRYVAVAGSVVLAMVAPRLLPDEAPSGGAVTQAPPAPVFSDYHSQYPGRAHHILPVDLPLPYATRSSDAGPQVIARPENAWPKVPAGFRVQMYAAGLSDPRLMRTAPNGDVFASLTNAGKIAVLRGIGEKGEAQSVNTFASRLDQPFGIAFYPPGPEPQWMYVATTGSVVRFPYRNGDQQARGKAQKICDLPGTSLLYSGGHTTRDIAFSNDGSTMYVSVGSRSNDDDTDGSRAEENRADILAFHPDGSGRKVFAWGIRNPVSIVIHPKSGELWTSVNERDGLGDNLPPDYISHVEPNAFFGWPWFYTGGMQDPRHKGKHPELKDWVVTPDVLIQPHNAPMQFLFYEGKQFPKSYHGDILAAQHGSWNRSVRTGYEVIRIPMNGRARAEGSYEDFMTGFVTKDGKVWGRPVGVAVASDGSLLVSDDAGGVIWRVTSDGREHRRPAPATRKAVKPSTSGEEPKEEPKKEQKAEPEAGTPAKGAPEATPKPDSTPSSSTQPTSAP
jgi:glucose/arabinose dehydrogenase